MPSRYKKRSWGRKGVDYDVLALQYDDMANEKHSYWPKSCCILGRRVVNLFKRARKRDLCTGCEFPVIQISAELASPQSLPSQNTRPTIAMAVLSCNLSGGFLIDWPRRLFLHLGGAGFSTNFSTLLFSKNARRALTFARLLTGTEKFAFGSVRFGGHRTEHAN